MDKKSGNLVYGYGSRKKNRKRTGIRTEIRTEIKNWNRRMRMIEVTNISKSFENIQAVDRVSVTVKENTLFGLIGTNGAGKSTVLRMIAGVLKADDGGITIDGIPAFDNIEAKKKVFFIADEPYFFANANAVDASLCSYRSIFIMGHV